MGRYDETELANRKKYLKAPTVKQINEFIKELGVTAAQFENFYSIPSGTIKVVRTGMRNLPPRSWNIVYEKIVPVYGATFNFKRPIRRVNAKVNRVIHMQHNNPQRIVTL